ncbi:MAG: Rho-binding antiterminator [Pseudomonadota bacterium]
MSDSDDKDHRGDYHPIACELYSEYEVAILHRKTLRLHWRDNKGDEYIERVLPQDLQTRDHCEFLIVKSDEDTVREIRLDRIISFEQEIK